MSKFAENVIKFAYENRANAMIAAKQAAERTRLDQLMDYINRHEHLKKGLTAGGVSALAGAGTYGISRALGKSKGKSWANAGIASGVGALGTLGYEYRDDINKGAHSVGEALKKLLYAKPKKVRERPNPGTKKENELLAEIDELGKRNSQMALGSQTKTTTDEMNRNQGVINRNNNYVKALNKNEDPDSALSADQQLAQKMRNEGRMDAPSSY